METFILGFLSGSLLIIFKKLFSEKYWRKRANDSENYLSNQYKKLGITLSFKPSSRFKRKCHLCILSERISGGFSIKECFKIIESLDNNKITTNDLFRKIQKRHLKEKNRKLRKQKILDFLL